MALPPQMVAPAMGACVMAFTTEPVIIPVLRVLSCAVDETMLKQQNRIKERANNRCMVYPLISMNKLFIPQNYYKKVVISKFLLYHALRILK